MLKGGRKNMEKGGNFEVLSNTKEPNAKIL